MFLGVEATIFREVQQRRERLTAMGSVSAVVLYLLAAPILAATPEIRETPFGKPAIHIQGEIAEGDLEKVQALARTVIDAGNEVQLSLEFCRRQLH